MHRPVGFWHCGVPADASAAASCRTPKVVAAGALSSARRGDQFGVFSLMTKRLPYDREPVCFGRSMLSLGTTVVPAVAKGRFELPRVAPHGPKPCASASSATSANLVISLWSLVFSLKS